MLTDALNTPITVMANAGEGGPWGMAVLAQFVVDKQANESLSDYLDHNVFKNPESSTLTPNTAGVAGYDKFIDRYKAGLVAKTAAEKITDLD